MSLYKSFLRDLKKSITSDVEFSGNKFQYHCDITHKGHLVLRVNDCEEFLALESPIKLGDDTYSHVLTVYDCDAKLIQEVCEKLGNAIDALKILLQVLFDKFEHYRKDSSFYFKVGSATLILQLKYDRWNFRCVVNKNTSYSYILVCKNLCSDLAYLTSGGVSLDMSTEDFFNVSNVFR